jgi:hypothetical protein
MKNNIAAITVSSLDRLLLLMMMIFNSVYETDLIKTLFAPPVLFLLSLGVQVLVADTVRQLCAEGNHDIPEREYPDRPAPCFGIFARCSGDCRNSSPTVTLSKVRRGKCSLSMVENIHLSISIISSSFIPSECRNRRAPATIYNTISIRNDGMITTSVNGAV